MSLTLIDDWFLDDVEEMVAGGSTYIDAVVNWCAKNSLEPEVGAELVEKHPVIRARMQMEAEVLSLLKRDE